MAEILRDISTEALVRAIEANEYERFVYFSRVPGGELHVEPELTWFVTGIPYLLFNGVLQARLPEDDLDARIGRVRAPFDERALPLFWMTGPSSHPEDLGEHLAAGGFIDAGPLTGMAVDLARVRGEERAPAGLEIARVGDALALAQWIEAYSASFDTDASVARLFFAIFASLGVEPHLPLTHYVGLLDDEPVATASLFLGAGVAGIYSIGTIPQARRRGIGAAMSLWVLREARRLGYHVAVLHAEPAGVGLYHRLGFEEYCVLHPYLWTV